MDVLALAQIDDDGLTRMRQPAHRHRLGLAQLGPITLLRFRYLRLIIIDLGEGKDIHPRNKQGVATRLARWALARDYGKTFACQSPMYKAMEKSGNKITLEFDHVGGELRTFDVPEPRGFAIAGSDHKFVWAKARITAPGKIEVWSDQVSDPVAVRYAWANNPVCNVYSGAGLPLTPFRTDDWAGVTVHNN